MNVYTRIASWCYPGLLGRLLFIYVALLLSSQVELTGKKRMNPENVDAIKNRFLELFIYR